MDHKCDVCGFEIESKNANPDLKEDYQGKTYNFCCPLCQATFKTLPEQFVTHAANQ
ncbi:MAG TPA: transcriptional regulator [Paenibacillaceae bacterium]|nr:transcriptional regulator [Paenibacillaceae bacterium]